MDDLTEPTRAESPDGEPQSALHKTNEGFARNVSTALSGMLRTFVEVKLAHIQVLSGREFLLRADNPTYLCVLQADGAPERFLLEINLSILFPIIDRLLGGGRGNAAPLERPLTEIELRLAGRIVTVLMEEFRHTWKHRFDLRLAIDRTESDPRTAPLTTASANLTMMQFKLSLGSAQGALSLGVPSSLLENSTGGGASADVAVHRPASDALVPVVAELVETKISAAELSGLEVGDIITTDQKADQPIVIRIDGVPNFLGRPGACQGRKAIRIQRPATSQGDAARQE